MVESAVYSVLPDGVKDRTLSEKECPTLINRSLKDSQLFSAPGEKPDWKLLRDFLAREGPITKPQAIRLL